MKYSFIGIRCKNRQEIIMLVLTSLQAFFIGAYISLFSIGSHVLFLQEWEPSFIPRAFIISGIIGVALFSLYSYLSNRLPVRLFTLLFLFAISVITILLYFNYDSIFHFEFLGILFMLPFTLAIPFTFIVLVLFRRFVLKIMTPDQHRRLQPFIRTSLFAGIIGASYAIVGTLFLNLDILLIIGGSACCIGLATIIQLPVNYLLGTNNVFLHTPKRNVQLRSRFYELFYSRYTILLTVFVVLSAITGFILHFSFISASFDNYTNSTGLAKFFGFYTGTMFLFIYGVERFLIRKILYSYDSPFSLVLIPALLVVATIVSLIIDLAVGQSPVIARFSFGFLMISIFKIGYETTYEAIELPSLRVLVRTLDIRFSNAITPRLEGTFRMSGLLIAGFILTGLLMINIRRGLFVNLTLLLLIAGWIPAGILLVKSYQKSLRDVIRRLKATKKPIEYELLNTDEKSHSLINHADSVKSINTLAILEKLEPLTHETHLVSLLSTSSDELRKYLLERIEANVLLSSLQNLKEIEGLLHHSQKNGLLPKIIHQFESKLKTASTKDLLNDMANSNNTADKILVADIVGNSNNQELGEILLHLSRDIEPEVKFASVKAIAKLGNPKHGYLLIGYLTTPLYYPYAFEALIRIGDPALPFLEQMFLLPDSDNVLLSRIVRIYGKIGTPAAIDLLLGKVENQNRIIGRHAILALREAKFQATPENINRILNDIVRLINIMAWNFAAYASLQRYRQFDILTGAMDSEIKDNYQTLYHLLALAYNPTSIGNIKNLLMGGNDTDVSFAIELLDQVVNEEIKQVFFPVVENISVADRYKQLQYFFQTSLEKPEELIADIITRDFNQLSLYVKSCALISMLRLNGITPHQEIIASIFHPNQLIRETAAYVLEQIEPDQLESVLQRLDRSQVNEIKTSLSHTHNGLPFLLIDRISFIKDCEKMSRIPEDVLLEISRSLEIHYLNKDEEFLIKRDDVHYAFMIIIKGTAQINNSSGKVFTFGEKEMIYSDLYVEDNTFSLRALTDLKLFSLEQEVLNSLMFDFIEFRSLILEMVEEV
jgi:ATP:ADP antiporter, AAA family